MARSNDRFVWIKATFYFHLSKHDCSGLKALANNALIPDNVCLMKLFNDLFNDVTLVLAKLY